MLTQFLKCFESTYEARVFLSALEDLQERLDCERFHNVSMRNAMIDEVIILLTQLKEK